MRNSSATGMRIRGWARDPRESRQRARTSGINIYLHGKLRRDYTRAKRGNTTRGGSSFEAESGISSLPRRARANTRFPDSSPRVIGADPLPSRRRATVGLIGARQFPSPKSSAFLGVSFQPRNFEKGRRGRAVERRYRSTLSRRVGED